MTTPQTNTTLAEIAKAFHSLKSFVICGHVSPDGDCIGSQLALYHALKALGKEVTCLLAKDDALDDELSFLPGFDLLIPASAFVGTADAFVACDVPTIERMGQAGRLHSQGTMTFTIDHHATDSTMSHYNYVDPSAASTTMIVWELIKLLGVQANSDMALCAYTGLATDTGGFRFQNSDAAAFKAASDMVLAGVSPSLVAARVFQNRRLASLQLEAKVLARMSIASDNSYVMSFLKRSDFEETKGAKSDADPLINVLRSLKDIRVACILREQDGSVRGSLRAKDETDVAAIAALFKGGGHKAAAGFTVYAPLEEALKQVGKALEEALGVGEQLKEELLVKVVSDSSSSIKEQKQG